MDVAEEIDIEISGSRSNPKVVEIDAEVIARLIIRVAHAREKPAAKAANAIIDYLVQVHSSATSARN